MSLLEEIYNGNIRFSERSSSHNQAYRLYAAQLDELEDKLKAMLNPEGQKVLLAYSDAFSNIGNESTAHGFQLGFQTGALLMIELFTGAAVALP